LRNENRKNPNQQSLVARFDNLTVNDDQSEKLFKKRIRARSPINGKFYHRLINGLVNDVNKGYAPVIAIAGQMGMGKSMAALELARILHNEVSLMRGQINADTVQDHLMYEVLPFLRSVNQNRRHVMMFDEAGVNLNSKDWYDDFNRNVDETIQTMRKKNNIYIFITPRILDLDKPIRNNINYRIEAINQGVLKPTKIKAKYGKITSSGSAINKFPLYKPYWKPSLPPKDLREAYREKENEFKDTNLEENIKELEEKERKEKEKKDVQDLDDIL